MLDFLKVSLPLDAISLELKVAPHEKLHSVKKVCKLFDEHLADEHVHILVQKPTGAILKSISSQLSLTISDFHLLLADIQKHGILDSAQLLSLNCVLLGDAWTKVFTAKVPEADNVSVLKRMIKEEKVNALAGVDASDLILYKFSPVDVDSGEADPDSKEIPAAMRIRLQPLQEVKAVFPEPLQSTDIHIIFERGSGACSIVDRFPPLIYTN